jgi:hypothetical protein
LGIYEMKLSTALLKKIDPKLGRWNAGVVFLNQKVNSRIFYIQNEMSLGNHWFVKPSLGYFVTDYGKKNTFSPNIGLMYDF